MTITAAADAIYMRSQSVAPIVKPLFSAARDVNVRRLGASQNFVVGLVPRGADPATVTAPDQLRVPTRVAGVYVNYYEVWIPDAEGKSFGMDRVYLHVHRRLNRDDRDIQLLSLHSDPALPTSDPHYTYRRGPHLHIGGAFPNIDRAHVSLCLTDPDLGGSDIDTLTEKLSAAVQMITDEFFPLYE